MIILFVVSVVQAPAQDSAAKKSPWTISGYLKDLGWIRSDKNFGNAHVTGLLHNRVNIKWKPSEQWSGRLEIRNRFYWGEDVQLIPGFKKQLQNANENISLSFTSLQSKRTIWQTAVERCWMEYRRDKWNGRIGRQRINWGIANTWNPNDVFNTYNFLDFDYEERPGSDALKYQYLLTDQSNLELAAATTKPGTIAAARYFTHIKKYDLQWIAGYYPRVFTAGFGWAGSIRDIGFKGELQYYSRHKDSLANWNLTAEADYVFANGWYVFTGGLYNQNGLSRRLADWSAVSFQASPRNLMPCRWNWIVGSTKELTPLFTSSLSLVYSPGVNMLIVFPSIKYNLSTNLDLDVVWQSFFAEMKKFQAVTHTGYLRLKWSF